MAYATADELARLLRLGSPSAAQTAAMERVLEAAAAEIDWWLSPDTTPADHPLVEEVNLERAVEHWQQGQSPSGLVGIEGGAAAAILPRNTFARHGAKLIPLRMHQGIA